MIISFRIDNHVMYALLKILVFTVLFCSTSCRFIKENAEINCGYKSCHPIKEGYVNIHLIPHSHDDVGWVKTVDQYYYGTNNDINKVAVIDIYDTVLQSLRKDKDRRFIFVETAFFHRWWLEQKDEQMQEFRDVINNGQGEFIGGGWSMNDEAVTNYQSTIDNMAWGLKIINDTVGVCGRPKIGWQIDPFGHSSEMASIFASLGYDGFIAGRIDYQDKQNRMNNKSMEMVWRGSNNLGRSSDIFTSILYNMYNNPDGFCFDSVLCDDDSLVDDKDSPEYNIEDKAFDFITNYVQDEKEMYQTSNVIVPMGADFTYQEAERWYRNMDKLIKYINYKQEFNGTKYHIQYSTPSCYTAAVHKETDGRLTSPLKTDDFLPYGIDDHCYWTGFYTSRPTLKRFERMGNNFLQICKQLYALTNVSSKYEPKLNSLREAMGVLQHHDAVTGTEKEFVAYDYARLLHKGFKDCEVVTNQALSALTNVNNGFETCLLLNISQCAFTEASRKFVVTVYNPLSREVNKYIRVPVLGDSYTVTGPDGNTLQTQIMPISRGVRNITGRNSNATQDLIFQAKNIPPLGFKSFYIEESSGYDVTEEYLLDDFHYSIKGDISFDVDSSTGLLNKISMNGISLDVDQRFWYYNGSNGWNEPVDSRPSGAYIFRPDFNYSIAKVSDTARFEVYQGNLVTEVHQTFNQFVRQVIRIYADEKYIEFSEVCGPLKTDEDWPYNHGKEVITRFSTPLKSASTFYTDSNGREMLQRIRNFRHSWNARIEEPASGNYYPITSKIVIEDEEENIEFAVLTDRSLGGSSLADGEVELMLLRNSVSDDQLGVGESLMEYAFNEPIMSIASQYVVFGKMDNSAQSGQTIAAIEHEIAERKLLDSWIFFSSPTEANFDEYKKKHSMEFSGVKSSLPSNVHILTLEPWKKNGYLLRLEHIFEQNEDPLLSQPVSVNLEDLFTTFEIKSLRETTLGGNQWLEDNQRLEFSSIYQSDAIRKEDPSNVKRSLRDFTVTLKPMQIRTFIIDVKAKQN